MIFDGPQNINEINRGLVKLLKADGYKSISEAVGSKNPIIEEPAYNTSFNNEERIVAVS